MKILILVPNINNAGGVARVLSSRINYMIENWNWEVHILTQNNGNSPLFYNFNEKVIYHDVPFKGGLLHLLGSYKTKLKSVLHKVNPDEVIVADNGLKAFLYPFLFSKSSSWLLEIHSSLFFNENLNTSFFKQKAIRFLKRVGAKKYASLVLETEGGKTEWQTNKAKVIPNPLWFVPNNKADLTTKKMVAAGRFVKVKGFERLLNVWKIAEEIHPDWVLEIYGEPSDEVDLHQLIVDLDLQNNVQLFPATNQIQSVFLNASAYLMTSHYEGFGMVLLEAMACGLPCVAYDCPIGPKALIENNATGFLIENNNEEAYLKAILKLMENSQLRLKMGKNGFEKAKDYQLDVIMQKWKSLLL